MAEESASGSAKAADFDLLAARNDDVGDHRRREQAVLDHADRGRESRRKLLRIVELLQIVGNDAAVRAAGNVAELHVAKPVTAASLLAGIAQAVVE